MRKTSLSVAIAIAIVIGILFFFSKVRATQNFKGEVAKASVAGELELPSKSSERARSENAVRPSCQSVPARPDADAQINELKVKEKIDQRVVEILASSEPFDQLAVREDSINRIALFNSVRSCRLQRLSGQEWQTSENVFCSRVPNSMKANPLKLLEEAARSGDAGALLIYATNAPSISRKLSQSGSNEAVASAAEMLRNAEVFAKQAAAAGSRDAMTFLARAYELGTFGARDVEAAYRYAKGSAPNMDDAATAAHLRKLQQQLPSNSAQGNAKNCRDEPYDRSVLINPFG